jgi:hypothetical protein
MIPRPDYAFAGKVRKTLHRYGISLKDACEYRDNNVERIRDIGRSFDFVTAEDKRYCCAAVAMLGEDDQEAIQNASLFNKGLNLGINAAWDVIQFINENKLLLSSALLCNKAFQIHAINSSNIIAYEIAQDRDNAFMEEPFFVLPVAASSLDDSFCHALNAEPFPVKLGGDEGKLSILGNSKHTSFSLILYLYEKDPLPGRRIGARVKIAKTGEEQNLVLRKDPANAGINLSVYTSKEIKADISSGIYVLTLSIQEDNDGSER